jgi:hypothetical protein
MTETTEPTAADLLATNYLNRNHTKLRSCGGCNENVSIIGITKLVYSFEVCGCDEWEYDHLVEQLWHRECFTLTTDEGIRLHASELPADAAVEYLRSLLDRPTTAAFMTLLELIATARRKVARSRNTMRDDRLDRIDAAEQVLRAAGRLAESTATTGDPTP